MLHETQAKNSLKLELLIDDRTSWLNYFGLNSFVIRTMMIDHRHQPFHKDLHWLMLNKVFEDLSKKKNNRRFEVVVFHEV